MVAPLLISLDVAWGAVLEGFWQQDSRAIIVAMTVILLAALLVLRVLSGMVRPRRRVRRPSVILDGSNIMHWRDGIPDLGTVCDVIRALHAQGYQPGVIFDANVGYKLDGRYQHHPVLARKLGLPPERVMVVNKGEVADGLILRIARDMGARVVSNDRFRDWAAQYPEVTMPDFLISGSYRADTLHLGFDPPELDQPGSGHAAAERRKA
ncbi:MAG: NYN domain-containing protein [Roseinatronobacter sp.]